MLYKDEVKHYRSICAFFRDVIQRHKEQEVGKRGEKRDHDVKI